MLIYYLVSGLMPADCHKPEHVFSKNLQVGLALLKEWRIIQQEFSKCRFLAEKSIPGSYTRGHMYLGVTPGAITTCQLQPGQYSVRYYPVNISKIQDIVFGSENYVVCFCIVRCAEDKDSLRGIAPVNGVEAKSGMFPNQYGAVP